MVSFVPQFVSPAVAARDNELIDAMAVAGMITATSGPVSGSPRRGMARRSLR